MRARLEMKCCVPRAGYACAFGARAAAPNAWALLAPQYRTELLSSLELNSCGEEQDEACSDGQQEAGGQDGSPQVACIEHSGVSMSTWAAYPRILEQKGK